MTNSSDYTGNADHSITLTEASEWTENYRNSMPVGGTIAHLFGRDAIQNILDQDGCMGIRIYYAIDEEEKKQLIVVGVDSNKDDLYEGLLAERSYPCPDCCSSVNPLNTSAT